VPTRGVKKGAGPHPEQVRNVEEPCANADVYFSVDTIYEPRQIEWDRDYHGSSGPPVLRTNIIRDGIHDHARKSILLHMYTYTFHSADTWRERRHACGVRANTKPSPKLASEVFVKDKKKITRTYVGDHDSGDRAEKDSVTAHEG